MGTNLDTAPILPQFLEYKTRPEQPPLPMFDSYSTATAKAKTPPQDVPQDAENSTAKEYGVKIEVKVIPPGARSALDLDDLNTAADALAAYFDQHGEGGFVDVAKSLCITADARIAAITLLDDLESYANTKGKEFAEAARRVVLHALDGQDATPAARDEQADGQPVADVQRVDDEASGKTLNGKRRDDVPTNSAAEFDDVVFTIATAGSRDAKHWKNQTYTWQEFKKRLQRPKISKDKDVGGYVGGKTVDGQRQAESIPTRSIFTADLDYAGRDFVEQPEKFIHFEAAIHSSHSHTDEAPRVRIVALQSRDCTAAEFCAISQVIADELGVTRYDGCSFTANQCMFWPSKADDAAPWYYHEVHGQPLNVDALLDVAIEHGYFDETTGEALRVVNPKEARAALQTVRDGATAATDATTQKQNGKQPATTAQTTRKASTTSTRRTGATLQDPRDKRGIIGALCRAYTIRDGIETFLSDFYTFERTEAGGKISRYTWKQGKAKEGLRVFEDKQVAYSYDDSNPATDGREYNLFDLLRKHLYNGDRKATEAALLNDTRVTDQLDRDKEAEVRADFEVEAEIIDDAVNESQNAQTVEKWQKRLTRDKKGNIAPTRLNVKRILTYDPNFRGFALNTLANAVEVTQRETMGKKRGEIDRPLPWRRDRSNRFWKDTDRAHLMTSLEAFYAPFKAVDVDIAFTDVTDARRFNPLQDWLNGLPKWDGVNRVETLLIKYMGADDNVYTRAVISKTLLAAVTRAFVPGCKFDYVTVLDGPQGIGKSTFWRVLAGDEYYTDNLAVDDMNDKTAIEKILGFWIVEIAELAGMNKAETEKMRTFITRQEDVIRLAYGRNVEHFPRLCVIVATVNGDHGYLNDLEGQRRFWPVVCRAVAGSKASDDSPTQSKGSTASGRRNWTITASERTQIWAEVYDRFKRVIAPHLDDAEKLKEVISHELQMNTPEEKRLEFAAQTAAIVKDERESRIESMLDRPIPLETTWNKLTISERQDFMLFGRWPSRAGIIITSARRLRNSVCGYEIWVECLGNDPRSYDIRAQKTVTRIMKRLAHKWINTGKHSDFGPYGNRAIAYWRNEHIKPLEDVYAPPEDFTDETDDDTNEF